jgi:hypothetical protein
MRKTLMDTTTALQDDLAPLAGILLCSISVRSKLILSIICRLTRIRCTGLCLGPYT